MRRRVHRERVSIANLSEWGGTLGALARRPGEQRIDHLGRLSSDPGYPLCAGTAMTVMAYAKAMREGAAFPPVFVVRAPCGDILIDGTHRAKAAALNGETEIDAVVLKARSEDDAGRVADAFWNAEVSGDYPSDRPDWGTRSHIELGGAPRRSRGRGAAVARSRRIVGRNLPNGDVRAQGALLSIRAGGKLTRLRRYERTPRKALACTHEGTYRPETVTAANVELYRLAGAAQDRSTP
jgi:hypothetical protein